MHNAPTMVILPSIIVAKALHKQRLFVARDRGMISNATAADPRSVSARCQRNLFVRGILFSPLQSSTAERVLTTKNGDLFSAGQQVHARWRSE